MLEKRWAGKFCINLGIIFITLVVIPTFLGLTFGGVSRIGSIMLCVFAVGIPLTLCFLGLQKVFILIALNLLILGGSIASLVSFAGSPSPRSQTISMFLMLCWFLFIFINVFSCFRNRKTYRYLAWIPIIISALTIPAWSAANFLGDGLRSRTLERNFIYYEEYAHILERQLDAEEHILIQKKDIPEKYQKLAKVIFAYKEKRGTSVIEFVYGTGFPVNHSIYAYIADDVISDEFQERWPRIQKIKDRWYRAGD